MGLSPSAPPAGSANEGSSSSPWSPACRPAAVLPGWPARPGRSGAFDNWIGSVEDKFIAPVSDSDAAILGPAVPAADEVLSSPQFVEMFTPSTPAGEADTLRVEFRGQWSSGDTMWSSGDTIQNSWRTMTIAVGFVHGSTGACRSTGDATPHHAASESPTGDLLLRGGLRGLCGVGDSGDTNRIWIIAQHQCSRRITISVRVPGIPPGPSTL
jgi:hypothetical protein